MEILYTAVATAYGGRDGRVTTDDDRLDVDLTRPGAPTGDGTNPEQLFAAGYAGCFHSAVQGVARRMGVDVSDSTVTARVGLGKVDGGPAFGLDVELEIALPKLEREQAEQVVATAHLVCPYSNATRGNVDVALKVV